MAIASLYPTIKPSLLLDFANSKKLDPRVTFTRSTTATYYDGVTTAKAEENLLTYSEQFNLWSNAGTTVSANATTAPDGTTTADSFSHTTTSGFPNINQTFAFGALTYACSIYFKYVSNQWVRVDQGSFIIWFDVLNGVVGATGGSLGTLVSSSVVPAVNGWYRCTFIVAKSAQNSVVQIQNVDADNSSNRVSGTSTLIWGAQLEQRSAATAYTPTTTQPITNYIPQLLTAPAGVPRFDHNPTTGESLGLLVEEQRTNTATWSESFRTQTLAVTGVSGTFVDGETVTATGGGTGTYVLADSTGSSFAIFNGSGTFTGTLTGGASGATATISSSVTNWQQGSPVSVLITANTVVAPNGTLTGDQITDNAANSPHLIFQGWTPPSSNFTLSFYAKYNNIPWVYIGYFTYGCAFNIQTGVAGTPTSNATNPTIVPVGNGWYRCSINITNSVGADAIIVGVGTTDAYKPSYVGTGSSAFIWGVQAENGAFPTSYIPTTSASVTRTADDASMTGVNFSSWYNAGQGTVYSETVTLGLNTASNVAYSWAIENSDVVAFPAALYSDSTTQVRPSAYANAAFIYSPSFTVPAGQFAKTAIGYQTNNYGSTVNGSAVNVGASVVVPSISPNRLNFASLPGRGYVRKLAYYPARLTNAQLQALTA